MFRSRNVLVDFAPREGDELELDATVGLYEARGEFQLAVESMRRAGQGKLFEQFLRLKERLTKEGLFDQAGKRPIPAVAFRVGVVTSLQAAALRDIVTTLRRRAPYVRVVVYPVPVQGAGAGQKIAQMLARVSDRAEVDVVIVARGGGSIEDLWEFNEEVVARAVRGCSIPVIVGVGHESDFTIADFAADLRAPTPTAAAELAAPDRGVLLEALHQRQMRAHKRMQALLRARAQTLDYAVRALTLPRAPIRALQARLEATRTRLVVAGAKLLAPAASRLHAAARALAALDPRQVLGRGFAIVRDAKGSIVTQAARLQAGDVLEIELAAGTARASVLEKSGS